MHSMKSIIFCGIVTLLAQCNGQQYTVGTLVPKLRNSGLSDTCLKPGPQCKIDCSTLMICAAKDNVLQSITCLSPNQYCVEGACTSKPGQGCSSTSGPAFLCTADGVFPNPSDCSTYHVCSGTTYDSYECPKGFVFNSKINLCEKGSSCKKIDCSRSANKFIVHPSNPEYYAYCMDRYDGTIQTIMYKCDSFSVFDAKIGSCKYNCKTRGYYQDPSDCQQYFYCSGANASPSAPMKCMGSFVFDGTSCNQDASSCKHIPITTTPAAVTTVQPTDQTSEVPTVPTSEVPTAETSGETSAETSGETSAETSGETSAETSETSAAIDD